MSNDTREYSKSGQPILRHERTSEFQAPNNANSAMEEIMAHFEKYVGKAEGAYHEIVSDLVHIDIHLIPASDTRGYHTLFTTGMSDLRMTVPDGAEEFRFAELMMCLPKSWPLSDDAFQDEKNYWPVRWLKILARLPHEYDTWLGFGHTIPNGDPARPFHRSTGLSCMLLANPSIVTDPAFRCLEINYFKKVNIYSVLPIYKEEMNLKLDNGAEELLKRFESGGISEILDIGRINVGERKKKFLFF